MQLNTLYAINTALAICVGILTISSIVGGIFVFRKAQKNATVQVQEQTIVALQQQIDALTHRIDNLEREKERQAHIIETIQEALKRRGILVTIDGDLVTISDGTATSSSMIRKRTPKKDAAAAVGTAKEA